MYDAVPNVLPSQPTGKPAAQSAHEAGRRDAGIAPGVHHDHVEKCPVIRANQIFLTGGGSGRMRVVFF